MMIVKKQQRKTNRYTKKNCPVTVRVNLFQDVNILISILVLREGFLNSFASLRKIE